MSDQQVAYPLPQQVQPLAAFRAGQGAIITAIVGGRRFQGRAFSLGLFPGQRITICQNSGSSLVVSLNGSRLALGCGFSQKILATPTVEGCLKHETSLCPLQGKKDIR